MARNKPKKRHTFARPSKATLSGTKRPSIPVWRGHLVVVASIGIPILGMLALGIMLAKAQWHHSIEDRLAAWQNRYSLDSSTVSKFKEMEIQFHGTGNPFTSPIDHNPVEVRIHHEQMASLLEPAQAERFRRDMNSGLWNH